VNVATLHADVGRGWLRDGRRVAEGLLVAAEGSSPFAPGAALLVDASGAIEGSVSGGCVESAVAQEALALLAEGDRAPARLRRYGISDDLAGTVGLTCGGTIEVLIHLVSGAGAAATAAALEARAAGRRSALATVVDGPLAGARLALVDGEAIGELGLLQHSVARDLAGMLAQGRGGIRRYGADGETLGREVRVFVEVHAPAPRMAIVGATDFSAALAPLARALGWAVTICDARPAFAKADRFARAADVVVAPPGPWVAEAALGPNDALLVFSHDPKHDEPAILAALAGDVGFLGALGSRRTADDRAHRLLAAGATPAQLARLHSPCGLDVGARTPEETAVSVLAEILATRSARSGAPLRTTGTAIHPR
jgi:xanthine dehydrogenase accessory factor